MNRPGEQIYRIGDVEVDRSQGCLKRGGQEQYLRPKTFQVLLYLLQHRQQLVTKEELMENIWTETAVTDDALVQCIVDIRKALGDDSRHPRFVKTIPKIGYRFIGPVEELCLDRLAAVETEEITSVEIEVEEEITRNDELRTMNDELSPSIHRSSFIVHRSASPRRRVALVSALVLILVMAVALVINLGQRFWRSNPPQAEVTLPQVPGKKPVVVMHFENQSGSPELDWLREGLADMLITDLSRSKKLTVLSRQQLHLLLERIGQEDADQIRLDEALELARRSQAEAVVLGNFAQLGEKVSVNVQLHDARSGRLMAAERLIVDQPHQILAQVDLLSLKLAGHLGVTASDQTTNTSLANVMTNNLEAYRYYSLALEKTRGLHNAEAIALLEKAVALDPQFAMAYARIGYVYAVRWGLADKAKPYLEKAFRLSERLTEKDKLSVTAWYAIANLDFAEAIQTYREIIVQYPHEVEAYLRLGYLLEGEERVDEAIGVLQQGLVIDPEAKELYNALGRIYSKLSRHDEAIAVHQRYVALAPSEPNAYDSLGMSYQWARRYEEAIEAYHRALELNPEFEIAAVHLGNVYFQQGRYREALRQYQRYIHIAPSDSERGRGYECLAWVYLKKGDLDRADEAARKEMKYKKRRVWNSLIIALERNDQANVEELKERLLAEWPYTNRGMRLDMRFLDYYRGTLALRSGQTAEAIAHFQEALRHSPPLWNIDAYEDCLANAYLELGRLDEAIAEYERILQLNPKYPLAHYRLGQAYERKGQRERARAAYERFLQIWKDADPDLPEVIDAKKRLTNLR